MRAAAQLISYEIAQGLALVGVVMMAGHAVADRDRRGAVGQGNLWYVIPQFVGFIIFLIAGFAETNRPPFDLPEADAELVQGYITEYGGGRFAAFYAAEYLNIIVVSALTDDALPRRLEHPVRRPADLGRPDRRARQDARSSSSSSSGCARRCRACATTS